MGLKLATLFLGALLFTGCATLTESPDCDRARQLFTKHNIDIDKFRIKPMTQEEFIESKKTQSGASLLTFDSADWWKYYRNYSGMVSAAQWACGTVDHSDPVRWGDTNAQGFIDGYLQQEEMLKKANQSAQSLPNPSMAESLQLLVNREGHEYNAVDSKKSKVLQEKIKQAAAIDITKRWSREDVFTYPSQQGVLKEDAKEARKDLFHKWVLSEYDDLVYVAFFNPQFQKLLSEKIPLRLDQQTAERLCEGITDQLIKKFGFHFSEQGGDGNPEWSVRIGDRGQGLRSQDCVDAIGPYKGSGDSNEYLREVIQDKYIRFKLAQHLLATALVIDAARISESQMKLTVQIDWPTFFAKYKFKNISDLIEK